MIREGGAGSQLSTDMRRMMSKTCFGYVVHAWGIQMSVWIATALVGFGAISAITAVNAGPCAPGSTQNCLNMAGRFDFTSVPAISEQIVRDEKSGQKQKQPVSEPPAPAPYSGPIFGASPRPGRTPIIGYSWSLE